MNNAVDTPEVQQMEGNPENGVIADPDESIEDVKSRKPAYCFYCGLYFTQRRTLKVHTVRAHPFEQQARSTTREKAEALRRAAADVQLLAVNPEPKRKRQRRSPMVGQVEALAAAEVIQVPEGIRNLGAVQFDMEVFCTNLKACKTVDAVVQLGQSFWKCYDFNAIICVPCYVKNPNHGKITYIFGMGPEDFTNEKSLPQSFRDLKVKIKDHVGTQSHLKNATPGLVLPHEGLSNRNLYAGQVIAKEVYFMVKNGMTSYNKFEERLACLAGHGIRLGNINHSSELARRLVPCLFKALKEQLVTELKRELPATGRPSFFSVSADKATIVKDTLHVIAVIFIHEGQQKTFLLKSSKNKKGDGEGLGEEIYDALTEFMDPEFIRAQCIGGAWDGGYVNVKPEISLVKELGVAWPQFLSWSWDASHVLELVMKGARDGEKKGPIKKKIWIKRHFDTIIKVRDIYAYGKAWDHLVDFVAEDFQKPLDRELEDYEVIGDIKRRTPLVMHSFCATRFQTYQEKVLEAILRNYRFLYLDLARRDEKLHDEISNASFVLRLCMLEDVNRIISVLSQQLQKVNTFTWIVLDQIDAFLEKIEHMKLIFQEVLQNIDNPNIPKTSRAIKELKDRGLFKRCPITNDRQSIAARTRGIGHNNSMQDTDFDEKITDVSLEICQYIQDIGDGYRKRLAKKKVVPEIIHQTRNTFSVARILESEGRPHDDVKSLFVSAASWWKHEVSEEDFLQQYNRFTQFVLEAIDRNVTIDEDGSRLHDDQQIYFDLLKSPDKCRTFKDVALLLSASMARSFCEAVTEGISSQLKGQTQGRESIDKERLFQEIFLKYHGPDASKENCEGLAYRAMQIYWDEKPWRFVRKCKPPQVKAVRYSVAIDGTIMKPEEMKLPVIPLPPDIEARLARIQDGMEIED